MQPKYFVFLLLLFAAAALLTAALRAPPAAGSPCISYVVDARRQALALYWRDEQQRRFGSIQQLKSWLTTNHRTLIFAMNGGMYKPNNSPLGLYIEKGRLLAPLAAARGSGNFYLKPNGIFYLTTNNTAVICPTANFRKNNQIAYATQSGPLLLINGVINTTFTATSPNVNIRNGAGILPDGRVLFAMSKKPINFYDFASYFKNRGCRNALYLDGLVSRTYLPAENWVQTDGDFGVIIGVTKAAD